MREHLEGHHYTKQDTIAQAYLDDAGTRQPCPACGVVLPIPGIREKQANETAVKAKQAERAKAKADAERRASDAEDAKSEPRPQPTAERETGTPVVGSERRSPRSGRFAWFFAGILVGMAVWPIAGNLMTRNKPISTGRAEPQTRDIAPTAGRAEPRALDIAPTADARWAELWPKLSFPQRPATGSVRGVTVKYDEFQDYTLFETKFTLGDSGFRLTLFTTHSGKVAVPSEPPQTVRLTVYQPDKSGAAELVFLADGKRIEPREERVEWERAYYELPTQELLELVNAKVVRGRVHFQEFTLRASDQDSLTGFASLMKP